MVWLYLPESEDLISESISLCQNQELFVMSRGRPMRPQYWQNKWNKGGFIRRLSGLMLSPSTAGLGVEKWISSLPDSPVNHGVPQAKKKGSKTKDGSGMILKESFAKFNQDSYSWKMSQASLTGDYLRFLSPFPKSGSMLSGALYERQRLEQIINETDFSFSHMFPTPNASDGMRTNLTHQRGNPTLLGAVQMFPTPTTQDSENNCGPSQLKRNTLPLNAVAGGKLNPEWVEWLMGWPIGWTDLEPAGMESCHFKPGSHIQSSSIELSKGGA